MTGINLQRLFDLGSQGLKVAKAVIPAKLESLGNFSTAVIQAFAY